MNQTVVRKRKWFWPWQDDREEAWLEYMSQQGLHLQRARPLWAYEFTPGAPQEYVYRLDFQDAIKHKNKEAYLQLFIETGWDYLGARGGWQYFRKPSQPGEEVEIYTDPETKIQKYNRYLTYLGFAFPSYLVVFVALWGSWPEWMMWLNVAIILLAAAYSLVVSIKMTERIKQLKSISVDARI